MANSSNDRFFGERFDDRQPEDRAAGRERGNDRVFVNQRSEELLRERGMMHQKCGGGRRIIKKKIGGI
jgi:hypothetical protein